MITVKFGDKDSYKDWGLILKPKSRPLPAPKTNYVSIEGKDGDLDLTTSLTGDVKYQNVSYSLEFTLLDKRADWESKLYEISTYLHGKKLNVIFSDDAEWYCTGRVSLNELTSNKSLGVISLDCNFEPYRLKVSETVINEPIEAGKVITLSNSRKWVMPTFKTVSRNLFDVNSAESTTSGVSVDSEGWITISCDNTSGTANKYQTFYTKNLDIKESTDYAIFCEIKNVSGTGSLYCASTYEKTGQLNGTSAIYFDKTNSDIVKKMIVRSRNNFTGVTWGLRTFALFSAGQSGSITFRLSVLENTNITEDIFLYEPYINANAIFTIDGVQYSLSDTLITPEIILKEGNTEMVLVSGEGNIRISYREGKL